MMSSNTSDLSTQSQPMEEKKDDSVMEGNGDKDYEQNSIHSSMHPTSQKSITIEGINDVGQESKNPSPSQSIDTIEKRDVVQEDRDNRKQEFFGSKSMNSSFHTRLQKSIITEDFDGSGEERKNIFPSQSIEAVERQDTMQADRCDRKKEIFESNSMDSSMHPEAQNSMIMEDSTENQNPSPSRSTGTTEERDTGRESRDGKSLESLTNDSTARPESRTTNEEAAAILDARIAKRRRESLKSIEQILEMKDDKKDGTKKENCLPMTNVVTSPGRNEAHLTEESTLEPVNVELRNQLNMLDARITAKTSGLSGNSKDDLKRRRSLSALSLCQLEREVLARGRSVSDFKVPDAMSENGQIRRISLQTRRFSTSDTLCQLEREAVANKGMLSFQASKSGASIEGSQSRRASMGRHSSCSSLSQLEQDALAKGCTTTSTPAIPGAFSEDSQTRRVSLNMRRLEQEVLQKECTINFVSRNGADTDKFIEKTYPPNVSVPENTNPIPEPSAITSQGIVNEPDLYFGTTIRGLHHDGALAVAVAVSEDEENTFIPEATQYVSGKKPPIYQNRRFRFYVLIGTILLVAIGMCVALILASKQSSTSSNPTIAPTSVRENMGIAEEFIQVVGESDFEFTGAPRNRANNWILHEDPLQLQSDAENLLQRYLLALFYFSTTERRPWRTCNAPVEDETSSCIFDSLTQVYPEKVYTEKDSFRWLSEKHECEWAGVHCDEFNQTRAINLKGQDILGTFPTELAMMPYIQSLTFSHNEFYGTIPSELAEMKHLINIEFHYNYFTGNIPHEYYRVYSPQRINFAGNLLTGSIPTDVGLLTTVKGFFVQENSLTGTIPSEVGNMKFLSKFQIQSAQVIDP